jgi:ketosteroid isomerase-like protein
MPSEAKAVIDQVLTAGDQGDMDRMVELTHPDCVITEPETLPYGGEYTGKRAFPELFGDVLATWETFEFEARRVATQDDLAFVLFDLRAETDEGGAVETNLIEVYQVEDSLVKSVDIFYQDTAALVALLERSE